MPAATRARIQSIIIVRLLRSYYCCKDESVISRRIRGGTERSARRAKVLRPHKCRTDSAGNREGASTNAERSVSRKRKARAASRFVWYGVYIRSSASQPLTGLAGLEICFSCLHGAQACLTHAFPFTACATVCAIFLFYRTPSEFTREAARKRPRGGSGPMNARSARSSHEEMCKI